MCNSMVFVIVTKLHDCHNWTLFQNIFSNRERIHISISSHSSSLLSQTATHVFIIFIGLSTLGISYKWNHVHGLWDWIFHLTCCSMDQYTIPFYGRIIFHCVYTFCSSIVGHVSCFHLLGIISILFYEHSHKSSV